jgi:hypothetical protein
MKSMRMTRHAAVVAGLIVGLAWLLVAGCGGESTRPQPVVKAMCGILVARGTPAGTPLQAGATVSVDGQLVTDAVVSINGSPLTYMVNTTDPAHTGYIGIVPASQGQTLTLTVTAAGQTVTQQAIVPGVVAIDPPVGGLVYPDSQAISISWQPAAGALLTVVTCGSATSTTPAMWLLAPTANQHTIPASATTVPGNRILIMGMNGSGDLPSTMDLSQWAGKGGFWVTSQDYLDVMITG